MIVFFSSGKSNSRGVAILFGNNFEHTVHNYIADEDGNYIIADLTVENNRFILINLYGPNKDCPAFFNNIINKAESINTSNNNMIICGDFNLVLDPELDYFNYKTVNNKKARETIIQIKENFGLIDTFRELHPTLKRYTWRKKAPLKQARLDFFLISENLLPSIEKCYIEGSYRSDHSMVTLEIKFLEFQKGKPLWKHNNSLLQDIEYVTVIKDKITDIKTQYALPVYNLENINNIPDDQIQFTPVDTNPFKLG